jgi:fructose-bisphosphate aldolase class II
VIVRKEDMTHPEEAKEFVDKTGVDFMASVIGNLHGICIGSTKQLDIQRLGEINKAVGNSAFLSLHGGSGISPAQIKKAIENGIVKININTELRIAWKNGIEKSFALDKNEVAPSKIMPFVVEGVERVAEKKMLLFSEKAKR